MNAFDKYFPVYQGALRQYEKDHPHWRWEVLVSLIKWGLRSLKHYIEDVRDPQITWESPFVELHYPIDWNWQARGTDDIARGGHIFGKLTSRNTATRKLLHKTVCQAMARQCNAMMLGDVTNRAWYEKLNNFYTPVLPLELSLDLNAIKNRQQWRDCFEELFRPFSIGVTRVDLNENLKSRAKVSKRTLKQLGQVDIPGIRFNGNVNGRKFDMGLIFEVQPLIADYNKKKAYHPITVGLAVLRQTGGDESEAHTPSTWPKKDRLGFWEGLLREIGKLTDQLIPKTQSQESVIISVNSKIKIPAEHWRPENRSATIKQFADNSSASGELIGIDVQAVEDAEALNDHACPVCGWIHDANFTQLKTPMGPGIMLGGLLPDIVRLVHSGHEKRLNGISTKSEDLQKICGGYRNPCKAFSDLKHQRDYKLLFDTRRRGFISLRRVFGRNRNKSEDSPE